MAESGGHTSSRDSLLYIVRRVLPVNHYSELVHNGRFFP
jgi:hypothetical protein